MHALKVVSRRREELIDVTREVRQVVAAEGRQAKACLVFVRHTSAAVTINEHADPAVAHDLGHFLARVAPREGPYEHIEDGEFNADAHIKAMLVGSSVTIPVVEGELALGVWQGIFFCEFDGPRQRELVVQFLG